MGTPQPVTITIGIRDSQGLPLDELATVHIKSVLRSYNLLTDTKESSILSFQNLLEGPYDVEVQCPGYQTVKQHLDVSGGSAFFTSYIYLRSLSDPVVPKGPPQGIALSPKAVNELDKGLSAMRKKQFSAAENHFTKAAKYAPTSPDIAYQKGRADIGIGQPAQARNSFEKALALDPTHEKSLLALGELQLQAGETDAAIATIKKSFTSDNVSWRSYYLLANAYAKAGNWKDAENYARRAVPLARDKAAGPLMLLADTLSAQGDQRAAVATWNQLIQNFPSSPESASAKVKITAQTATQAIPGSKALTSPLESSELNDLVENRLWAPPDIDSQQFALAEGVSCNLDDVLARAIHRAKNQLENLEKFTATEHIEHQEIDKHGQPGPMKERNFSYIVFVYPFNGDSVFLEESRDGGANLSSFPTSLATTGLNSLGISVLQPAFRHGYTYQCEGLASIRGEAVWQIRFEEKQGANLDVRRWQRQGMIYNIPLKGRMWITTTTYDLVRIATDLREPVSNLELTRDHLQIDYGTVNFLDGTSQLWLPWNAEMYLELHGKRYHHKHVLTNYLLFGVDTSHKIGAPKNVPVEPPQEDKPPQP